MTILGKDMDAWAATTLAYKERIKPGKWSRVVTVWEKETDTWKVVAQ